MLGVALSAVAYGGGSPRPQSRRDGHGPALALAACVVAALWSASAARGTPLELDGVPTPLALVLQALVFRAAVAAATLLHEVRWHL